MFFALLCSVWLRFASVLFSSVLSGPVLFGSVRFGSVRFGSVRFGSVRFGSVRFGSVRFGSVRFGSARFGSVRFGSVRFGSVRFGSIWRGFWCSVRFSALTAGFPFSIFRPRFLVFILSFVRETRQKAADTKGAKTYLAVPTAPDLFLFAHLLTRFGRFPTLLAMSFCMTCALLSLDLVETSKTSFFFTVCLIHVL